jgi:ABC-type sugar transport system substrate-binding protein
MALGGIPAQAAEPKIKIGVTMALFDDVWLTNVRDAMTKWAKSHPDVELLVKKEPNPKVGDLTSGFPTSPSPRKTTSRS